jgi:hypothetical protein
VFFLTRAIKTALLHWLTFRLPPKYNRAASPSPNLRKTERKAEKKINCSHFGLPIEEGIGG